MKEQTFREVHNQLARDFAFRILGDYIRVDKTTEVDPAEINIVDDTTSNLTLVEKIKRRNRVLKHSKRVESEIGVMKKYLTEKFPDQKIIPQEMNAYVAELVINNQI